MNHFISFSLKLKTPWDILSNKSMHLMMFNDKLKGLLPPLLSLSWPTPTLPSKPGPGSTSQAPSFCFPFCLPPGRPHLSPGLTLGTEMTHLSSSQWKLPEGGDCLKKWGRHSETLGGGLSHLPHYTATCLTVPRVMSCP